MQVPFACIKIERGCYSSFILRLNVVVADLWFFFAEVCAAVDLDDLFFGCFAWVGEAADVFLGVFCHDLEIFWLDAEHTQVVWNADLAADQTDGVDAGVGGFGGGHVGGVDAHGFGNVAEAVHVANDVEFFNIWQEDGVADAVWQVVVTAELVGHCMDIAEGGVVERDTGEVLCIGHFIAGAHVVAVGHCLWQIFVDHFDGLEGGCVGQRVGIGRHVGFDGVGHGVHTGGCGEGWWHAFHELWVVDCDFWRDAPVDDGHLDVAAGIGDDAETGDLRCGTGCGVDGEHWHEVFGGFVNAFVIVDAAAVGSNEGNAFGAVVGGTAAEGDDGVAGVVVEEINTGFDVFVGWVWFCTIEHHGVHAGFFEDADDAICHAGAGEEFVGNDHCGRYVEAFHEIANFVDGAFTKNVTGRQEIIGGHKTNLLERFSGEHPE